MENDKVNEFLGDVPLKKIGKIRMPEGLPKRKPFTDSELEDLKIFTKNLIEKVKQKRLNE